MKPWRANRTGSDSYRAVGVMALGSLVWFTGNGVAKMRPVDLKRPEKAGWLADYSKLSRNSLSAFRCDLVDDFFREHLNDVSLLMKAGLSTSDSGLTKVTVDIN